MAKPGTLTRIPNTKPTTIGCYTLTSTGLEVKGKPSFGEHQGVGDFIQRAHQASGFWLADWLRYGETRGDWTDRLSQAVDASGLSEKTLKNVRAIGAIEVSRRRDDVDFAIHSEVASLAPAEQTVWLEKAHTEGWSQREMRMEMRAAKRRAVISGQAILEGKFRVIYADPPWAYNNRGDIVVGKSSAYKRAEEHYPTMMIEDICKLPVEAHAEKDAILFLWVTSPLLFQNPGPREVVEAWGFEYKSSFVWDKVLGNFGHYNHVTHEFVIVATRGSCLPDQPTPQPKSVFVERRSDTHSQKPESFRKLIEKHWPRGPYLELFAREKHEGWTCFGNDSRLWSQDSKKASA